MRIESPRMPRAPQHLGSTEGQEATGPKLGHGLQAVRAAPGSGRLSSGHWSSACLGVFCVPQGHFQGLRAAARSGAGAASMLADTGVRWALTDPARAAARITACEPQ